MTPMKIIPYLVLLCSLCSMHRNIWRAPIYRWRRQLIRLRNSFQSQRYRTTRCARM